MASRQNIVVGAALAHLRKTILLCSLLVGASLLVQTVIWSLASFTDLRWTTPETEEVIPLIVQSDGAVQQSVDPKDPAQAIRAAATTGSNDSSASDLTTGTDDDAPQRVASDLDASMGFVFRCARGLGSVGIIALMPSLMLGVLVAASGAMRGCEKTVAAFTMAIVVAMLILPLGHVLSMPWSYGALSSYEYMTGEVDAYLDGPARAMGPIVFYARFLVMPVASLIGLALVYLRFSASVELTILAGDEFRVDSAIEDEASGVQVGVSGSRTTRAFDQAVAVPEPQPLQQMPVTPASAPAPKMTEAPKRLI